MISAAGTWHAALDELSRTISPAAYQAWFAGSTGVSWVGDEFTVEVPDRFVQEWIDIRFRGEAEAALARAAGRRLALVVVVAAPPCVLRPRARRRHGGRN